MYTVYNNVIRATKGDTVKLRLMIEDALGNVFVPESTDTLLFTVKKYADDTNAVIQKTITGSDLLKITDINLSSTEMNQPVGKYIYDIQLSRTNGEVFTVIASNPFYVGIEVGE